MISDIYLCADIVRKDDKPWRGKAYINLSCNVNFQLYNIIYSSITVAHQKV